MTNRRVFLFANGDCNDLEFYRRQIKPEDLVVCVDGGSRYVLAMGIRPTVVVGDFDSIDQELRRILEKLPVEWVCDPAVAQEQSDLEMALDYALSLKPSELVICSALGGSRVDHALSNIFLLTIPYRAGVSARIIDERQTVQLVDRQLTVAGEAGDYVSLFPLTPEVTGVVTEGLKYPLYGETLYFASSRGLSNELLSESARITAASGLLLVIHTKRTHN
ncbi:MAG: thiamine diphosphokinase [Firmicutes bacterium]|jgi:thiamine pyrophosphokinase|nr:thiamine diphosphokinase [Bacillota bacterium]HPU01468.1 thiamine diphosphokinase [Bacillota bacterium]